MNKVRLARVKRIIKLMRQRQALLQAKPPIIVGFLKGGRPP